MMGRMKSGVIALAVLSLFACALAASAEVFMYRDDAGKWHGVGSANEVPEQYRDQLEQVAVFDNASTATSPESDNGADEPKKTPEELKAEREAARADELRAKQKRQQEDEDAEYKRRQEEKDAAIKAEQEAEEKAKQAEEERVKREEKKRADLITTINERITSRILQKLGDKKFRNFRVAEVNITGDIAAIKIMVSAESMSGGDEVEMDFTGSYTGSYWDLY
ncbi:MAG TPA: hypothetical protein VGK71_03160 [Nitrospirota bacterium]|jgi:hypothetical protein